jgi:hypothetical protein
VQAPVTAALITSTSALGGVVIAAGLGYWSKHRLDTRVGRLEKQQREDDAWRSYTFEARKRLYLELGPLLFALVEACEELQFRVRGIARSARDHRLEDDASNRFGPGSDYMLSTLYRLMAPLAVIRRVQTRLTLVDLSVDPAIDRIYALAKLIRRSWNAGHELAEQRGLPYQPLRGGRTPESAKQHINLQAVDRLAEHLIPGDQAPGAGALVGYSSFVARYRSDAGGIRQAVAPFERLLDRFHPDRRPVLWQLLETQALICATISHNASRGTRGWGVSGHPQPDVAIEFVDWYGNFAPEGSQNCSGPAATAAFAYVHPRLPASLFDGEAQPRGSAVDAP